MTQSYNGWTKEALIEFELDIEKHFLAGEIRAPVHFSRGNEESLIKIFADEDIGNGKNWCFSSHRSHYHALLHGIPPDWLKEQILLGRSMHINSREHKFMTSSIVGGCPPIALGVASELKRQGSQDKVWCFVGDMASSVGSFKDCWEYARNFDLPVSYIIEDNNLSTNSPTNIVWGMGYKPENDIRYLDVWNNGGVYRYCYERLCAHINVLGKWVIFK